MSQFIIYHNPRCSKSRQTLALLEENGVTPDIVEYLQATPDAAELEAVIAKLGITPRELLRKGEDAYRDNNLADPKLTDAQLIAAMVAHPKLIERPIVVADGRAVLGRPPENVLALLN
jgi:arsenate reductase